VDAATAFDAMASSYDSDFTSTVIGRMMRAAVWARCAERFSCGARILEMNCGTGEDALWLAGRGVQVFATDVSPAMIQIARGKPTISRQASTPRFECLAWEQLEHLREVPFDGLLSNFGGLNCVADLRAAAKSMAHKLRPGATAILCLMGPRVPWEWAWFLARGTPSKAFRRLKSAGSEWRGVTIQYPSITTALKNFTPEFRCLRVSALGALLPPPYAEKMLGQHRRLLAMLNRIERRMESVWPLPQLADHYVLELERV
jgi:SAM-dependent methyltransferase